MPDKEAIVCVHTQHAAPGDLVVMSAFIRDLATQFGDRFTVDVETHHKEIWRNNPHITKASRKSAKYHTLTYGHFLRTISQHPYHYLTSFYRNFQEITGIRVPVRFPYGDLHLSEEEKEPLVSGRYWVVLNGGKSDFTVKIWSYTRVQQVVDRLRDYGIGCVQTGAAFESHRHGVLDNCLSTVGTSNLRDMMRLIYHADGVLCPVTAAMHMAAAFQKPCVVWGGGREHWWWEAYVNSDQNFLEGSGKLKVEHRYLHTLGLLDCCPTDKGCWLNKVVQSEEDRGKRYCKLPVQEPGGQWIPECMRLITVDHVVDAVLSYYTDGLLSWPT